MSGRNTKWCVLAVQVMKTLRRADTCCVDLALSATRELLTGTRDAPGSVKPCLYHGLL